MTRMQWVLALLIGICLAKSCADLDESRRLYERAQQERRLPMRPGRPVLLDAACWKATQPWTAPEHLTSGLWIEGRERGVHGICYATRAACEAAWETQDPEHVKWDGFCWDPQQNPQDVGW